jgi:hypothetical protein
MDTTISSHIITSKFHWFDRFLAALCIIFGLFMVAGMGTSASVVVRNIDASLGLLRRETPYYFKNIEKINFLTQSINANAQFGVAIIKNLDLDLKEILILAFKFVLKKIVAFLLSSLRGILNNLLSSIRTWINTLSGLLDSVKSFLSALAMKVYSLMECVVKKSEDVVSGIFGLSFSKVNSALGSSCGSGSGSARGATFLSGLGKIFSNGTTGADLQTIVNSVENFRLSSLLNYANQELIPGSQPGEAPKESGTNVASTNYVVGSADLQIKQKEISDAIGIMGCDTSAAPTAVSALDFRSWSAYNASCTDISFTANNALTKAVSLDQSSFDKAKKNTVDAAPADCKFTGFLSDTPTAIAATAANNTTGGGLNYSGLTTNFAETESFSANTVSFTKDFDTKILTAEQCKSADALPATLNNQQTQVQTSQKSSEPVDSSLDGALNAALNDAVNSLIEGITTILNDFVKQVFQLVIQLVNKFVASLPGGEFLSQSLTNTLSTAQTNITNSITKGLNALKNPIKP